MQWFRIIGLLLVGVLTLGSTGCGAPAPAPAATPAATVAPTAPPTSVSATATGAASGPAGSPTAPGGATPAGTARTAGKKTEVTGLWVSRRPEGYTGGTSRAVVGAEKGSNRELRVGFFEDEVAGTGPMWRAAGWMAVIVSSLLLGIEPTEYRFSYEIGGRADGPSGGALMTIATMASLLGHTVKSEAAMTGTINPDGTIGPVGGIPHKIDGAAEAKKTLVLIPAGQRQSMDFNLRKMVDVVERGKGKGIDVREVADIYEAYELMTGQPLPKPAGMKEVQPALPGGAVEGARGKVQEWQTRYAQSVRQYEALPQKVKDELTDELMAEASHAGDMIGDLQGQELTAAAYNRAYTAAVRAAVAYHTARTNQAYAAAGRQGAIKYVDGLRAVSGKIDEQLGRLETQQAGSLGDVLTLATAYGNVNGALGMVDLGAGALKRAAEVEDDEVLEVLTGAAGMFVTAEHLVDQAGDALDIGLGHGTAPPPAPEKVQSMADLFRRAAEANLNYFDSIVLNEIAQGLGMQPKAVKERFATWDLTYASASSSLRAMNQLKSRAGSGLSGAYAVLGGATNSYVMSSVLVAKYYSLETEFDKETGEQKVKNERAMNSTLDFAEKRSKEVIGLAVGLGAEPVQPVIHYEGARLDREGSVNAKFNALQGFWSAALQGQMLAMLSGKAGVVR